MSVSNVDMSGLQLQSLSPQCYRCSILLWKTDPTHTIYICSSKVPVTFPVSVLDELVVDSSTPLQILCFHTSSFTNSKPNPLLRISLAALPRPAHDGGIHIGWGQVHVEQSTMVKSHACVCEGAMICLCPEGRCHQGLALSWSHLMSGSWVRCSHHQPGAQI